MTTSLPSQSMEIFIHSTGLSTRARNGLLKFFVKAEIDPKNISIKKWAESTTRWGFLQTNGVGRSIANEVEGKLVSNYRIEMKKR